MTHAVPAGRRCTVVGAGVFGLSAAWALSRRGWEVEVLEAGPAVGHDWSGSKGGARVFRLGYPEAHHVDMARRAADLWQGLAAASGRHLLHRTGQASLGDEAALRAVAGALASAGVPAEWLSPDEVRQRFPQIAARAAVLFEPSSGVLAADECLRALCETADFELRTRTRASLVHERGGAVTVTTEDGRRFDADVAVVCAGPWTLGLVGGGHAVAAPPSAPQVAYFGPAPGHEEPALPVFIEWGEDMVYGLPVPGGAPHGGTFKVSQHVPGVPLTPDQLEHGAPPPDDRALLGALSDAVRRLLPGLHPEPLATERCVYDNSANGDFVLDRVGRVVIGCGSSGHGFKFGPLVGELLADLAEGVPPAVDLFRFRVRRGTDG